MKSTIALLTAALLAGCATAPVKTPHPMAGVMVVLKGGHGSGVHIGNGIVLTSAHVVGSETAVTLKGPSGAWQQAHVIWKSDKYDVAALRPDVPRKLGVAPLNCTIPAVGEYAIAYGSPINDEFLYLPGYVVGKPVKVGNLESVSRAAIPVTSGNSGGPVFDSKGRVIGIVAAVQVATLFNQYPSQTGIAYFVPGNVICGLLGRG